MDQRRTAGSWHHPHFDYLDFEMNPRDYRTLATLLATKEE